MNTESLKKLLEDVKSGKLSVEDAVLNLKKLPFEDLGFAKVDHHRNLRTGYPEVVFCQGKTVEQVKQIMSKLMEYDNNIMATRASRVWLAT